jgi:acylphosphatase
VKACRATVSGRVQGVWFRASTREEARRLGVEGWVRNLEDGSVEVFMQGEDSKVDRLLAWSHHGPAGAVVVSVDLFPAEPDISIKGFIIKY